MKSVTPLSHRSKRRLKSWPHQLQDNDFDGGSQWEDFVRKNDHEGTNWKQLWRREIAALQCIPILFETFNSFLTNCSWRCTVQIRIWELSGVHSVDYGCQACGESIGRILIYGGDCLAWGRKEFRCDLQKLVNKNSTWELSCDVDVYW